MLIQLVCILKSFVAYRAVVLLAGAGEGTLFSLFESGGGGLFDGFAAVLDGCGMADRLEVIIEGKLSRRCRSIQSATALLKYVAR